MKKLVLIILLFSVGSFQQSFAQKQVYPNVDSLHPQLSESNVDTNTVRDMLELSKRYFSTEPDTAMKYAEKAKLLAEKLKYP